MEDSRGAAEGAARDDPPPAGGGGENSNQEFEGLRTEVSTLSDQFSELSALVKQALVRRTEESGGASHGAAGGVVATHGGDTAGASEGAPQSGGREVAHVRLAAGAGSTYGPIDGQHSGEARGHSPREVRVAAATELDGSSSFGSAAGAGGGYSYQNTKYSPPPFNGKASAFLAWIEDFISMAKAVNLEGHIVDGGIEIPVHDKTMSKAALCSEFPADQVDLAFHAWNFLRTALTKEEDRQIMKRAVSPQEAIRELVAIYDPESAVSSHDDMGKLMSMKVPTEKNPLHALREMEVIVGRLQDKEIVVNQAFLLHLFLDALSDEFAMTKHNLRRQKTLTRDDVVHDVTVEFKVIMDNRKGKGARGSEKAYIADGDRGARSSGRGRGRGRNSSRGGGNGGRGSGGGGGGGKSTGGSSAGDAGGSSSSGGGAGDSGKKFRCYRCGKAGHIGLNCTTPESERLPQCDHCSGFGHKKDARPTEEAVLAEVMSDVDSVENQALMAEPGQPGECGTVGLEGVVEHGQEVMKYVADTAATCSMFTSPDGIVNYRECGGSVKGVAGKKAHIPLLGYGDVTVVLQSEDGWVPVSIINAAHVPEIPYNLISIGTLAEEGHSYVGKQGGLTLTTAAGGNVWFPRNGKLLTQVGYQTEPTVDIACAAVIVPGKAKAATPTDLNYYHDSHGHTHERLLRITAKQQGVELTDGPLRNCLGCSMSKGQVKSVKKVTDNRAVKKLLSIFLDLGGRMQFVSIGGNWYTLIIIDDCSRCAREVPGGLPRRGLSV